MITVSLWNPCLSMNLITSCTHELGHPHCWKEKLLNGFEEMSLNQKTAKALSKLYVTKVLRTIITLVNFVNRPHHQCFGREIFWLHKLLYMYIHIEYRCHTKIAECTKDKTLVRLVVVVIIDTLKHS